MDKKSIITCIIGLGLFIGLIIWRNSNQNDLKKHGVIVEAQIIRVNLGGRTSGGFQCLIKYKNKEKELPSPSTLVKGSSYFVGKTFPAMYLPGKDILEILITPPGF